MIDILAVAYLVHATANAQFTHCDDAPGADVLAFPEQVEAQGCGDCEDLALWRYEAMMSYGAKPEDMQISIINNGTHAVLDVCNWQQCYRMEHGQPLQKITGLSPVVLNPATMQRERIGDEP